MAAPSSSSRISLLLILAAVSLLVGGAFAAECSQCTKQCSAVVSGQTDCPYPPRDKTYEYFLFVLQWPGTFCKRDNSCCDGRFPDGVDWTIHGLWPEKSQNCYPYCCDLRSVKYTPQAVTSLKADLRKYWPTLSCSNTDDSFHSNEWDKHGTCMLAALRNQSSVLVYYYFERVLDLYEQLPLGKILADENIKADNRKTYSPAKIIAAIEKFTGATPDLACAENGKLLDEVHFCLDNDLKTFFNCPLGEGDRKKCGPKVRIPELDTVLVQ
ncbi:Ribonuclease T2 family protein [Klebsormidium nitens]|uniref:Ribonuclease T2 family protein n=1 Tax=Klebsormidium nitens TaxID=105231 RepID=A0A1Y1HWE7_KLENI|nr:Ribonuclease T2 family protein [Klebsormidium nitens]|eukprot:GAQ80847.1 Ribonuclease T2 family protein [Klebsormidium nitens]